MVIRCAPSARSPARSTTCWAKAAEFYEDEVDEAVKGLSSLMEPFIIVILGTIIGGIVVSMYLPIFKLGQWSDQARRWTPRRSPCRGSSRPVLALFGLCIGSFLNVVIHRWPLMLERRWRRERRAARRRHRAGRTAHAVASGLALPVLRHRIRWHENIPVLGWLRLRGRCSACKTPISPRYRSSRFHRHRLRGHRLALRRDAARAAVVRHGRHADRAGRHRLGHDLLPDNLTLPLLWAGIVAAAGLDLPLPEVWGAVAGYLSLWSVYWLFKLLTGKEGMGFGDFKLLAALGAWLGLKMILPIVLIALADRRRGGHRDEAEPLAARRALRALRPLPGRRRLDRAAGRAGSRARLDGLGLNCRP